MKLGVEPRDVLTGGEVTGGSGWGAGAEGAR